MSVNAPFTPLGNTVTFTAANVAPTAVQGLSTTLGGGQYRVVNAGNVTVFMGVGSNAALANINGGTLVVGSGANVGSIPLLATTTQVLSLAPNYYFTGQVATGTAVVYVTPGDGSQ